MELNGICLLTILCLILMVHHASTNMATQTEPARDGNYYIEVCFDQSEYSPTCGWEVLVSCSYPLTNLLSYTYNEAQRDEYSFIVSNKDYNAQLNAGKCQRMTLEGSWGNTNPTVAASWFCVCNASTSNVCETTPFTEVPPHDATTQPTTTTTATTDAPAASVVSKQAISGSERRVSEQAISSSEVISENDYYSGYELSDPNQIILKKDGALCYTGPTFSTSTQVSSVFQCARLCLHSQECAGVNYRSPATQCDLVSVSQNVFIQLAKSQDGDDGCQYWGVSAKLV